MNVDAMFVNATTHSAVTTVELTELPRAGDFVVVPAWGGDFALVLGVTFGNPGTRPLVLLSDRRFPMPDVVAHVLDTAGLLREDAAWSKVSEKIDNPFQGPQHPRRQS